MLSSVRAKASRAITCQTSHGFTLVELLVALVIVSAVVAALVNVTTSQIRFNQRSIALNAVDSEISTDLAWLRNYAQSWKLSSSSSVSLSYNPGSACASVDDDGEPIALAQELLNDASAVESPPRPQPLSSSPSTQALNLPPSASGYTLNRTISIGANGNTLLVSYALTGTGASALDRSASILIPASAWCF